MDYTHFLNGKPSIKLFIEAGGKHGVINLCSTYGCYDKVSNIELVENEIVKLICPHCKKELPTITTCDVCGAPIVSFAMEKGGKVHVCSRIGCKKHAVSFEDIYTTLTNFYEEDFYGARETDF
jgi:ssDNA-binding Zn-finger/Zn-ribbon topoisomerase 1